MDKDMAAELRRHALWLLEIYWTADDSERSTEENTRLLTDADLLFRNAKHIEGIAQKEEPNA